MSYKLLPSGYVLRLRDQAAIPPDPNNSDFIEYQQWAARNPPLEPPKQPVLGSPVAQQQRPG